MNIEMGKIYWKINNSVDTFDTLLSTLEDFGMKKLQEKPLGTEFGFHRVTEWESPKGIRFSTVWYKNLCHLNFGNFDTDLCEVTFDSICGSYLPYEGHNTIDFTYNGNRVLKLAIKR